MHESKQRDYPLPRGDVFPVACVSPEAKVKDENNNDEESKIYFLTH